MLEAVRGCGSLLQFASATLRDTEAVVAASIQPYTSGFKWASARLRDDVGMVRRQFESTGMCEYSQLIHATQTDHIRSARSSMPICFMN